MHSNEYSGPKAPSVSKYRGLTKFAVLGTLAIGSGLFSTAYASNRNEPMQHSRLNENRSGREIFQEMMQRHYSRSSDSIDNSVSTDEVSVSGFNQNTKDIANHMANQPREYSHPQVITRTSNPSEFGRRMDAIQTLRRARDQGLIDYSEFSQIVREVQSRQFDSVNDLSDYLSIMERNYSQVLGNNPKKLALDLYKSDQISHQEYLAITKDLDFKTLQELGVPISKCESAYNFLMKMPELIRRGREGERLDLPILQRSLRECYEGGMVLAPYFRDHEGQETFRENLEEVISLCRKHYERLEDEPKLRIVDERGNYLSSDVEIFKEATKGFDKLVRAFTMQSHLGDGDMKDHFSFHDTSGDLIRFGMYPAMKKNNIFDDNEKGILLFIKTLASTPYNQLRMNMPNTWESHKSFTVFMTGYEAAVNVASDMFNNSKELRKSIGFAINGPVDTLDEAVLVVHQAMRHTSQSYEEYWSRLDRGWLVDNVVRAPIYTVKRAPKNFVSIFKNLGKGRIGSAVKDGFHLASNYWTLTTYYYAGQGSLYDLGMIGLFGTGLAGETDPEQAVRGLIRNVRVLTKENNEDVNKIALATDSVFRGMYLSNIGHMFGIIK